MDTPARIRIGTAGWSYKDWDGILYPPEVSRKKIHPVEFLARYFDVIEIVERKNAATYQRVLVENGAARAALTMVGDAFFEDIVPVVRLGGRAIHVPAGRWVVLRRF